MPTLAPFPVQPELTAIAIAYKNPSYIADAVLPRVPIGVKTFKYTTYTKAERFTIPNTLVGRTGRPNEVQFGATETESTAQDYGLDDPVPQDDIDQAAPGHDPLGRAVEGVMDLVMLDREKRVADLVFTAGNYPTGNKTTLSGTSQWSDYTNSDPVADINSALDTPLMRPNVLVIGRAAWSKLASHPKIMKAVQGNSGDAGIARRQQIAELFELEEILVGDAWYNTAKEGQAATFSRVWGKHAALLHRNRAANTRAGITFGFTAQYGSRIAGAEPDKNIGLRGGQRVRTGETVKEVICASDVGYLYTNAVA